jgi:integrase
MVKDAYIYPRSPTAKGWSLGTAWTAKVRLPGGAVRQFYGPSRVAVEEKVGAWRIRGGPAAEARPAPGRRFRPREEPTSPPSSLSAGAWLTDWAKKGRPDAWDTRRHSDAVSLIRRHVAGTPENPGPWASIPLADIDTEKVDSLLDRLKEKRPTQDNLRRLLRTAFREWSVNPVPGRPRRRQRQEEQDDGRFRILSRDEWRRLVEACQRSADPLASAVVVALEGVRSSELRALRFCDSTGDRLIIRRVVVKLSDPYKLQIDDVAKTRHSNREIPLSDVSRSVLADLCAPTYHEDYAEGYGSAMIATRGSEPDRQRLIWPAQRGKGKGREPIDQSRLSRVLDRLRETAGIPKLACRDRHEVPQDLKPRSPCPICGRPLLPLRFHDLRHSCTSHLLAAGIPIPAVQERMGWGSPAMLRRYAHATPEVSDLVVKALADIVGKERIRLPSDPLDEIPL